MPKFTFNLKLPKNLPLLFKKRTEEHPSVNVQAAKDSNGVYQYYTYSSVYNDVICFAAALKEIGIKHGSNVALISDNRREWLITDLAILSLGGADVPRGCDSLGNEIRFIIKFADCEYGFFENARQLKKVMEKTEEVPDLKTVILFERPTEKQLEEKETIANSPFKTLFFDDLLARGKAIYAENPAKVTADIENDMNNIKEEDNATIIFTSGTTGTPKGVMLTHKNYMSQLSVIHNFLPCKVGEWWLSVLPVWHSFERVVQYVAILFGNGVAYSKPVASAMLSDMAVIKPQWMCGVPRLWEALCSGVTKTMKKAGGIKYKLFNFFIGIGKKYTYFKDLVHGRIVQIKKRSRFVDALKGIFPMIFLWPLSKLGDLLVFKKIREKFGGKIKMVLCGGGALQEETDSFFKAINVMLLEGYGLTETAPVVAARFFKKARSGCIGKILPTCEVKIVPEENGVITSTEPLPCGQKGMVLIRSTQLMKGYYKRPDLTEKVVDKDGFFNTGDIGLMTFDHELKITGRAKDTIVLLGGENIEPAVIESELCTSPYIESAIVVGQDQRSLASLIVPVKEAIIQYAHEHNIKFENYEHLLKLDKIKELIMKEVNTKDSPANGFRLCERISKIALLAESFKVGIELSAKQEMMRFKIVEKYAEIIAGLNEACNQVVVRLVTAGKKHFIAHFKSVVLSKLTAYRNFVVVFRETTFITNVLIIHKGKIIENIAVKTILVVICQIKNIVVSKIGNIGTCFKVLLSFIRS